MMGNPDDAQDVVQDTFLSAYRAGDRFRGEAQVTTWLYRIATNAALMRLRKNSHKKEIAQGPLEVYQKIDRADWADAPDKTALNNELAVEIQKGIEELPEDLKVAVIPLFSFPEPPLTSPISCKQRWWELHLRRSKKLRERTLPESFLVKPLLAHDPPWTCTDHQALAGFL